MAKETAETDIAIDSNFGEHLVRARVRVSMPRNAMDSIVLARDS